MEKGTSNILSAINSASTIRYGALKVQIQNKCISIRSFVNVCHYQHKIEIFPKIHDDKVTDSQPLNPKLILTMSYDHI